MLAREKVLPHTLAHLAGADPDGTCMVDVSGRTQTYRETHDAMLRWAAAFRRLGVEPGDRVVTMMPNSMESFLAWLGVGWLRAIETPANNMYLGDMLRYLVTNSQARVVCVSARFVDRMAAIAGDCDLLEVVVVPDADPSTDLAELPVPVLRGDEFFGGVEPDDGRGPEYHDISAMIYTSGTTGPSKGVLVPWAELYQFVDLMPPDAMERGSGYYTVFPAFHVSGKSALYVSTQYHGYLVIRESFSVEHYWDDVREHNVTLGGLVGPMAAFLLLAPPRPDDADNPMQHCFMGPLLPNLDDFKSRFGVEVGTGFGMTEIGAPLISNAYDLPNTKSCGRPRDPDVYPGYEVRVVDEHDEPVGPDTVGELVVRAREPWVLNAGYFGMPDKTAEAWRNGWFHTGDGFTYDDDGNFYFVDRLKDAIRVKGENVSSFEVESHVNLHPAVQESAAIAVPSPHGEDDIKVVVVARADQSIDPAELVEFLIPRMPRFMIPRYVEIAAELPKTQGTFRTQKVKLRAAPADGVWDRVAAGVELPKEGR